jgi:hypothetical protein
MNEREEGVGKQENQTRETGEKAEFCSATAHAHSLQIS